MANYSVLVGCPSPAPDLSAFEVGVSELTPYDQPSGPGWGPLLIGRYSMPLFWVAGFEPSNIIQLTVPAVGPQGESSVLNLIGAVTSARDFAARIRERRRPLLSLFPPPLISAYGALIDAWVDYVLARFPNSILLHPYDIPFIVGEDFDALFAQAIDAVARFGATRGITLDPDGRLGLLPDLRPGRHETSADAVRAGLFGYCDAAGAYWPPDATAGEIAYFE